MTRYIWQGLMQSHFSNLRLGRIEGPKTGNKSEKEETTNCWVSMYEVSMREKCVCLN
jgi:hypothetical protein